MQKALRKGGGSIGSFLTRFKFVFNLFCEFFILTPTVTFFLEFCILNPTVTLFRIPPRVGSFGCCET